MFLSLPQGHELTQTTAMVNANVDGGGVCAGAIGDCPSTRPRRAHHQSRETAGAVQRAASIRVRAWDLGFYLERVSNFMSGGIDPTGDEGGGRQEGRVGQGW